MKITNDMNLPIPLVRAITNDPYEKGLADFSVTELLSPPLQVHLRRQHEDEIVEDASDRIWSLLGQSVHHIVERSGYGFDDSENRIYLEVDVDGTPFTISGKPDHAVLLDGILQDYKVTSAWTHIRELRDEWIDQTNIYARMLFKDCPEKLRDIQVVAIYRDWSRTQMMRSENYPRKPVAVRDVPRIPFDLVDDMLAEMIRSHLAETPRPCTDEERWKSEDKWAVYSGMNKRAKKLCDTEEDAEEYIDYNDIKKPRIEFRPGISRRCEDYCAVSKFCPQYKEELDNAAD